VVGRVFDEAERRDPGQRRRWVALVDGNNHQIDRIEAEAAKRSLNVVVVVDLCRARDYADSVGPRLGGTLQDGPLERAARPGRRHSCYRLSRKVRTRSGGL